MKILLVADGRSPITRGWVQVLRQKDWEITLVSTFPCPPVDGVNQLIIIPAAFSSMGGSQAGEKSTASTNQVRGLVSKFRGILMTARYWLGPLSLGDSRRKFLDVVSHVKPDIVHALRIPFEGMLARVTPTEIPFLVSIWGNDLTLHANGSPLMNMETRRVLQRTDGLLADAHRDLKLAEKWGLREGAPVLCVPGGGGLDLAAMQKVVDSDNPLLLDLPSDVPVIINPRGFRPGSVRNDTFFKSIPLILEEFPLLVFVCPGMAGQPEALDWVSKLGINDSVRLLPLLPQQDLWRLFKRAQVSMSISQHDGTPNSLLEAMALGCFPVAGDIESVREWIVDGVNGLLVDPGHAVEVAEMVVRALNDRRLRENARVKNQQIINTRADKATMIGLISKFYLDYSEGNS